MNPLGNVGSASGAKGRQAYCLLENLGSLAQLLSCTMPPPSVGIHQSLAMTPGADRPMLVQPAWPSVCFCLRGINGHCPSGSTWRPLCHLSCWFTQALRSLRRPKCPSLALLCLGLAETSQYPLGYHSCPASVPAMQTQEWMQSLLNGQNPRWFS